ncbi:MAG: antitoxin [Selenomonas artemidis]
MECAALFETGRSQAVRLPNNFRFHGKEVFIQRLGKAVILVPKEDAWETFLSGLEEFTDDFFADGRGQDVPSKRDAL